MAATFALYPSDVNIISFFKCKIFHITWGKPAVKFLKVAILAKDQSRDRCREMESWCSVKHRRSAAQMSRWTTYLKCWLGLQGLFKSIFINFIYINIAIYLLLFFFHICKWCFCCILKCEFNLSAYQMDSRDRAFQKYGKPYRNLVCDC